MRKFLFVMFAVLVLGVPTVKAEVICNINGSFVNIRKGPSAKNYPIISRLSNRAQVRVLKRVTNPDGYHYFHVEFSDSQSDSLKSGYVYYEAVSNRCDRPKKKTISTFVSSSKTQSFVLPSSMTVKTKSGCNIVNPAPLKNATETVKWSGKCIKNNAWGDGTIIWFKNGKYNGKTKNVRLENGFWMRPAVGGNSFSGSGMTYREKSGRKCYFVLPISGLKRHKKYFSFKYDGRCPKGKSTYFGSSREKARATIYFRGKKFARFNGVVAGGIYPVSGTLKFFSGAKFTFTDNIKIDVLTGLGSAKKWVKNIRYSPGRSPQSKAVYANKDKFNVQLAFNATPEPGRVNRKKLIFFPIQTVDSNANLFLNYRVTVDNAAELTAKKYKMILQVTIGIKEKISSGWISIGEKRDIHETISIMLKRQNSYVATGKVKLGSVQTFLSGFVTQKVSGIEPSARILSVQVVKQ